MSNCNKTIYEIWQQYEYLGLISVRRELTFSRWLLKKYPENKRVAEFLEKKIIILKHIARDKAVNKT